jgi:hypothetical protein
VTLRARWVTRRARWLTLRARWVTLRARWVTLRARWVTPRVSWVTLRARWVTLRARWVTLRARGVRFRCGRRAVSNHACGCAQPQVYPDGRAVRRVQSVDQRVVGWARVHTHPAGGGRHHAGTWAGPPATHSAEEGRQLGSSRQNGHQRGNGLVRGQGVPTRVRHLP